jgi:hypothetical protein
MRWSWSENQLLDNMQRTVFCLILVLVQCGGVAAEFSQLSERANAPIENGASKVTSAKELFGAVTAPELASHASLVQQQLGSSEVVGSS